MMSDGKFALARLPPISGRSPAFSPRSNPRFEGVSGTTYKLGDTVHQLPAPHALKPFVDTKAGEIDTWPAHASGHSVPASSLMLTKNKSLVLVNDEAMGKPRIIPKPRFLDQLEIYLKKEIRALGVTEVEPNELRLQAHREVFEYLIEDFKTYKPVLSAIKNEYEMMLAYQRQQIRELEPLKQMLVTVSEQCDQKIIAIREEEKQELKDMRLENKNLQNHIQTLNNEKKDLQTQVKKLQEDLEEQYLHYRDECDARKLLISDLNDMRYQQEDYLLSKQKQEEEDEGDPKTLKIALKKAREDEKAASKRLNEMIANYGDVIPRRDFEGMEKKYNELLAKVEVMNGDFATLKQEHDTLLEVHKQVVKQRDEFYTESETLKRSSTPRPDWEKCADFVKGGIGRWKELSDGKRSNELVDILLSEMASGEFVDNSSGAEYFEGQGTGPSIPKYLRCEGQVRNRRLGKRDTSLLIKDIWREKIANDAEKSDGERESLSEFLYTYLKRRFGLEQMIMEWGYNLHDACQRYSHDDHIGLFWGALSEEIDEEIYHSQLKCVQKLLTHLTNQDMAQGNKNKLSRDDFKEGLRTFLTGIEEDYLNRLVKAAEQELEVKDSSEFEYKNLFMEDDEGRTGQFLDDVRKFHTQERMKFVEEIKTQLSDINPVSVNDLKRAITLADMDINKEKIDKYMSWAFKTTKDKVYDSEPVEQSTIIQRLQHGNLLKTGWKI